MSSVNSTVICFGEVLWDILPTEKVAGGAPMNVAIRLQSFNINSSVISKIGNDSLGKQLLKLLTEKQVNTSLIQLDNTLPTGKVQVHLDNTGTASYTIVNPSAWDAIEWNETLQQSVATANVFVYGSLSCRNEISKTTLFKLLSVAKFKIFDVNLRSPFYTTKLVIELMQKADFIKLNDDELAIISQTLNSNAATIEEQILLIAEYTNTNNICVTRGKNGAILYINNHFYEHSGYQVTVADTIGAGDSFLAALIVQLLAQKEPAEILPFACAVGSLVASKKGGTAAITSTEIEELMQ